MQDARYVALHYDRRQTVAKLDHQALKPLRLSGALTTASTRALPPRAAVARLRHPQTPCPTQPAETNGPRSPSSGLGGFRLHAAAPPRPRLSPRPRRSTDTKEESCTRSSKRPPPESPISPPAVPSFRLRASPP